MADAVSTTRQKALIRSAESFNLWQSIGRWTLPGPDGSLVVSAFQSPIPFAANFATIRDGRSGKVSGALTEAEVKKADTSAAQASTCAMTARMFFLRTMPA